MNRTRTPIESTAFLASKLLKASHRLAKFSKKFGRKMCSFQHPQMDRSMNISDRFNTPWFASLSDSCCVFSFSALLRLFRHLEAFHSIEELSKAFRLPHADSSLWIRETRQMDGGGLQLLLFSNKLHSISFGSPSFTAFVYESGGSLEFLWNLSAFSLVSLLWISFERPANVGRCKNRTANRFLWIESDARNLRLTRKTNRRWSIIGQLISAFQLDAELCMHFLCRRHRRFPACGYRRVFKWCRSVQVLDTGE